MKTYPVVEITFSPTGGTKKVADLISCYLGNITNPVNLIRHDVSFSDVTVPSDSLAVIAAPVFEGVIPDIAIERMKEIQGNHANCVVIAVYGNRAYDDGLIQLKDTAELCSFNVIASVAAVAEHSIMRQFGSGRPDAEDSKELKKFAEEILEKLSSDEELSTDYFVPGSHEYKRLGTLSLIAGIDLLTGIAIPVVSETHKSSDFICLLKKLDEMYLEGDVIRIICDNHSAHKAKEVQNYLATKPEGRYVFVFIPKHASWLNLIECFFSKMAKQMLKGIRVKSKQELADRIYQYFDEINKEPVVFHWTYKLDEISEEEANPNMAS